MKAADVLTYAVALLIGLVFLFPLAWLMSLALRNPQEIFLGAARFIPDTPTLDNFRLILTDRAFGTYLWNTLKLCALGALVAVTLATPAAYAASRFRFRGRGVLLIAILAVQMVSPLVIIIPLYRYMDRLGVLENHATVILLYAALGVSLSVWLIKTGFDAVPRSLEDAAAIDGCGRLTILWRITLPLALPALVSAFVLNMMMGWSQFLVPFILLTRDGLLPVSVAIFNFAGSSDASTTQLLAAACLIAVIPALVAFLVLQRVILRAIMAGAGSGH